MTASDDSPTADIPFYLMPIAAILGSYALFGSIRAVYLIYANLTFSDMKDASSTTKKPPSVRLNSSGMLLLVATVIFSMVGYAKIVAQVNYAILETEYALFDPYDILGISSEANSTIVKQAYRTLSKQHHPDKGGEEKIFHRVNLAYRALTTDFDNFQKYGHPDGPLTTQSLAFALPEWLLRPQGSVAVVLVLLYLGMFVMVGYYVVSWLKASSESSSNSNDMSVSGDDTMYMVQHLSPDSSHWDVLLCIATAPESISISTKAINKIEEMKREKLSKLAASSKKVPTDVFDLDGGGWDDDDHDAAKKEAEELQKQQEQIKAATGATDVVLEGVDQGVLGQKWVENTLEKFGQWPPLDLGFLEGKTFDWKGRKVGALDHPAIRRNLCFTMGRLNSIVLNTHTELLEASSQKMIDQTYFKGSMEYRQRAGILLEAALRVAVVLQSYRLTKIIVETVAMFKIGVSDPLAPKTLEWFRGVMRKQYGEDGLPRLAISDLNVATPGEQEIATNDLCAITMTMERSHAEAFTKTKVAICQKQGIPPQVAIQTYREGWWVLVRAKKLDGGDTPSQNAMKDNPIMSMIQDVDTSKFDKEPGDQRLMVAWPLIVQNMAQKSGNIKVQFKAPSVPGKYNIYFSLLSQEFLGADQEFELPIEVLDSEEVKRKQAEEEEGEDAADETKKDK